MYVYTLLLNYYFSFTMALTWLDHHYLRPGNKFDKLNQLFDRYDKTALLHAFNYK